MMIRLPLIWDFEGLISLMGLKSVRPKLPVKDFKIQFLNLDTRTFRPEPGVLFFAHKGKNHDSHGLCARRAESTDIAPESVGDDDSTIRIAGAGGDKNRASSRRRG